MERNAKIRLIYSVFLGVFTLVVGILFLAQAADIYFSGVSGTGAAQGMYSRALVGERLRILAIPLFLWAAAIVEGIVVYALFPVSPSRGMRPDGGKIYARLRTRAVGEKEPSLYQDLRRAEKVRLGVRIFTAVFCLLAAVMSIVYLADASHFTSLASLNGEVLRMVANVLPWTGAALLLLVFEALFEGAYVKKYLPVVKKLVGGGKREERETASAGKNYAVLAVRCALFVLAVVFLVLGALNGGTRDVLIKAINICTECIGLG